MYTLEMSISATDLRINLYGTDHWSLARAAVSGGEEICIGGQLLKVIFAPVIFI